MRRATARTDAGVPDAARPAGGLSRRQILAALPALAAAVACGARWPPEELAERLIAAVVGARRGAWARVGRAYLAADPGEADLARLTGRLARRLGRRAFADGRRLATSVAEAVAEDFRAGRTTRVAGWVLAATEARIAAVVALRSPASG